MRASTTFSGSSVTRSGNWSVAEEIPVRITPAPTVIRIPSVEFVPEFREDEIILRFEIEWSVGENRKRQTSSTPTGYQVAVGPDPIEVPFGEVPMDTVTETFVSLFLMVTVIVHDVYIQMGR